MSDSFGIPQLTDYFTRMGLKLARVEREQELIELIFHGSQGRWRMIVGIQQSGDVRKLMLIVPHIGVIMKKKRLECLEALMAANYRIAIGKFGVDLNDGEVRLEETIPLANNIITFEQFQLAFGAIMQTVAIYHGLLPRIVQQDMSTQAALQACEQEFFRGEQQRRPVDAVQEQWRDDGQARAAEPTFDLNVEDVLAEVTRLLEGRKD